MWLKSIRIVNVGPFEDLKLNLTRGSIGVFGPNGSGKSTLLNTMYGLITNDWGRFAGDKADCIRNVADSKEDAFVRGVIEHGGHTMEITRRFRGKGQSEVEVDGGAPITDARKVKEEINKVLGVDDKLIDLYVFKPQNRIYDFIDSIPSVRAKAYQTLCRTEACETAWQMLGDYLNQDRELNAEVIDNSDELNQDIAKLHAELHEIGVQEDTEREHLLNTKSEQSARQILKNAQRYEDLGREGTAVDAKIEKLINVIKKETAIHTDLEDEARKAQIDVDCKKAAADEAKSALAAIGQWKAAFQRRTKLENEAKSLETEPHRNPAPVMPALKPQGVMNARNTLALMRGQLEHAQSVLRQFGDGGKTECPTCGTAVDALHDHIETCREKVADLPAQIKKLDSAIREYEDYQKAKSTYDTWFAGYEARLKANREALEATTVPTLETKDEPGLKKIIDGHKAAADALAGLIHERDLAKQTLTADKARLAAHRERKTEIETERSSVFESEDRVQQAKRRLDEHTTATNNMARLRGERTGLEKRIQDKQDELARLQVRLRRSRHLRAMSRSITIARDVLHRDRLPRRVAQVNLAAMEGDINRGLELFGSPFWVESDSSLSFVAHKPGEPPQPATWLSTGQRVVLALAFWPAVASLWASDLGMLALDEPTANLDGDNRKFLRGAVSVLSGKVRGRRQLIMVTHDQDLRQAFDQVVDLGA